MPPDDPNRAGIKEPHSNSPFYKRGDFEIHATQVPSDCFGVFDDIDHNIGIAGRREAMCCLLEYYYQHPQKVIELASDEDLSGESTTFRVRNVHGRYRKLLYDLNVELGGVSDSESIAALCRYYENKPRKVLNHTQRLRYK